MGEIADMMLDGTLCATCGGVVIKEDENPSGIPTYCNDDCKPDDYENG